MSQTIEEKNKALVLKAFDTLFNKRDYAAAEKYWSPNYIQHSRAAASAKVLATRFGIWARALALS
jgi:predicted SnoaL-like aldol condensation-catalyzing enzyme